MSSDFAIEIIRRAVLLALTIAGPMLLGSLLVGVVVSLIQAVTQIQEQTLTFIPKILALGAILLITLPWIISSLMEYLMGTFSVMGTLSP